MYGMELGTIDLNKLRGLSDKFIGLQKEILGTVLDNDRWIDEGEAQQERGTEQLKALRAEAKAQKHEAKAQAAEAKQKTAQRLKESA